MNKPVTTSLATVLCGIDVSATTLAVARWNRHDNGICNRGYGQRNNNCGHPGHQQYPIYIGNAGNHRNSGIWCFHITGEFYREIPGGGQQR